MGNDGSASIRECVEKLIALAEAGKFLEAIEHCYAHDATMQENSKAPRVGLAALLENERRVLASFKEIRVNRAESFLVDGNRSAINWVYEFIDHEGRSYLRDEIAYQVWQDGKIIQERFFYDPVGG
jgi:ketosteroid isomerase-like protein